MCVNRLRIALAACLLVPRAEAARAIDFASDIQPIFAAHCLDCHGPDSPASGLRLDQRASLLRGGDHGEPAVVPERPAQSFLLRVVRGEEPDLQMPPDGPPLTAEQVALLETWIATGAHWPGQMEASADDVASDHWSFQPMLRADPPTSETSEPHPIDAFVVARLRPHDLQLSDPADPVTQLRRVHFVLTGLPPDPEEVEAALQHPEGFDVAYALTVERLLASVRYGERWAQHWLDVIRWAETAGFETNAERPTAWPYRDWVIRALNEDKPYDRFLFEQLAGDAVGEDAALGFLVAGPANLPGQIGRDEESMRQARQDELDEVVRTVGEACLGLTVGCARCHNHRFDPILQQDYYAMQGIFAGLSYGDRRLRGAENDAWTAQVEHLRRDLEAIRSELDALRGAYQLREPLRDRETETFAPVAARAVRMEIAATTSGAHASLYELEAWSAASADRAARNVALASAGAVASASSFALANQTRHFDNLIDGSTDRRQAFPWVSANPGPAWVQVDFNQLTTIERIVWDSGESVPADYRLLVLPADSDQWITVAHADDRMLREDDVRPASAVRLAGVSAPQIEALVARVADARNAYREMERLAAGPQVFAARFAESPEETWLLRRGDPMQRLRQVAPAIPLVLGKLGLSMDEPEQQRRIALARHLTRPDHPLTARVMVNRVWQKHFGAGLVDTPSDFGAMGSPPSHPELLDWLAVDFAENGWSLKRLHRHIVTSRTFRQSSRPLARGLAVDADARLLWRFPPRRLEAEAIRDCMLDVSGKLNETGGGPGFSLFNQRGGLSDYVALETFDEAGWRRMIYAHKVRMQAVDVFGSFDCPDAGQLQPKRTRSVTPIQALGLFNSPFGIRQGEFFAERVRAEAGDEPQRQIDRAFRLAFSRPPNQAELEQLAGLVQEHGLGQLCRVLLNTSEFLYIP